LKFYHLSANPHHEAAQSILNLFRGRAKAEDVINHLETLRTTSLAEDEMDVEALIRNIAVQSLLHIGSRSFSHLLNAIERYLPLLRNIAGITTSSDDVQVGKAGEAKMGILTATARFWRANKQMVVIVFDKFMQYQIVDPSDVVVWTFSQRSGEDDGERFLSGWEWEIVRAALDKANGRVASARRKVTALRKEDDDTRARQKAGSGVDVGSAMEVDADAKPGKLAFILGSIFHID
jgi:nuclear cap-binding protein subunit 1